MGFALISGFLLETPKSLDSHIVNACVEVTSHNNHTLEGGQCQCGTNVAMLGTTCRYQVEEATGVIGTFPWVTYSLLINLLTKILPSLLMIVGNIRMIRRYHQVTAMIIRKPCKREYHAEGKPHRRDNHFDVSSHLYKMPCQSIVMLVHWFIHLFMFKVEKKGQHP